jgi:hypothetical protein
MTRENKQISQNNRKQINKTIVNGFINNNKQTLQNKSERINNNKQTLQNNSEQVNKIIVNRYYRTIVNRYYRTIVNRYYKTIVNR